MAGKDEAKAQSMVELTVKFTEGGFTIEMMNNFLSLIDFTADDDVSLVNVDSEVIDRKRPESKRLNEVSTGKDRGGRADKPGMGGRGGRGHYNKQNSAGAPGRG